MIRTRYAFLLASAAFVLIFAGSGAPIPAYALFRSGSGISNSDLALAVVGYFLGTVFSLLLLGRLSDFIGRKPLVLLALASAITGLLLLTLVHGLPALFAARVAQGIACGLAASSVGAYIIDTGPTRVPWLAATIVGSGSMLSIPLGALFSGLMIDIAPAPTVTPFVVLAAVLALLAIPIAFARETVTRIPGALRSLVPRFRRPPVSWRVQAAIVAAYLGTWCIGAFYQAYAPSLTVDELGSENPLVAAVVFSSVIVLAPLGGPFVGLLGAARAMRLGIIAFCVALAGAFACVSVGALWPFVACSLVAAVSQGAIISACVRLVVGDAPIHIRAALLSTVYAVAYSLAAIVLFGAGSLANAVSLPELFFAYVAFAVIVLLFAWIVLPRRQAGKGVRSTQESES